MQHRIAFALWSCLAACSDPTPTADAGVASEAPQPPAPDDGFLLGAAGAPRPLFGPDTAPTFAAGFASLAADGFNRFMPVFLTSESGAGSSHPLYFLPTAVPGVPLAMSCASASNPWNVLPAGFAITFPAYLPILDQSTVDPLDTALARMRLLALVNQCLGGDTAKIGEAYLYDEPATQYIATEIDNVPRFNTANVVALAELSRVALQRPTMVVEAPTPFWLPYIGATPQQIAEYVPKFWAEVDKIAPHTSWYGFDTYPIDTLDDVTVIGEYLDHAKSHARNAKPIAVLQAFGAKDMMIEGPTEGRRPVRAETRVMALFAVARGASGIYWYGGSALTIGDGPLWDDVREVVRDLRRLSGVLAGARTAVDVGNPKVGAARWRTAEGSWFVLANPTNAVQSIAVSFEAPSDVFDAITGARMLEAASAFTRELAPHESLVIVIPPS